MRASSGNRDDLFIRGDDKSIIHSRPRIAPISLGRGPFGGCIEMSGLIVTLRLLSGKSRRTLSWKVSLPLSLFNNLLDLALLGLIIRKFTIKVIEEHYRIITLALFYNENRLYILSKIKFKVHRFASGTR